MANIIIKSAGDNKVAVIREYKMLLLLDLADAKAAVDGLAEGREIIIPMEGANQELIDKVVKRFRDLGADAYEDKFKVEGSSFAKALEESDEIVDVADNISVVNETVESEAVNTVPDKAVANVGTLDRDTTMKKLIETGKIAKKLEELNIAKGRIVGEINNHKKKAQEIREYVPTKRSLMIFPFILIMVSFLSTIFILVPIAIIISIVWYLRKWKRYEKTYLAKHGDENNSNADKYIAENVVPLEEELEDVYKQISDLYESGKVAEAVDFVGEDMFVYGCIEDLYNLIKSRKADNLKEALNLYDDTKHKARMEEMQLAIQNASEVAAVEAAKQTALTKDIARNTHQAATAAKATAYHTRQVDKNTRQFRKK